MGELARERGLTTSQLALLWAKDQPGVTAPIIGPRTLAQLDDALAVLDLALDDDARAVCDALVHPGQRGLRLLLDRVLDAGRGGVSRSGQVGRG